MPVALLRSYVSMMPRLIAEDSARRLTENLLGSGWAKPEDVRGYQRELQRQITRGAKPTYASPGSVAQAMGLKVVRKAKVS